VLRRGNEIIMRELMIHVNTFVWICAKTGEYLAGFLAFVDL
jgi:hypothetical protein